MGMLKETLGLWGFGLTKVPLILYCRPVVVQLDEEKAVVRVPLRRRTKNHLNSMYFGALCVGADCAGGIIAMHQIWASKQSVSLVFQGFKAEFLKRPEADVHFVCTQGAEIKALVAKAIESGERESMPVNLVATTPSLSGDEPVARFEVILSLKAKGKK